MKRTALLFALLSAVAGPALAAAPPSDSGSLLQQMQVPAATLQQGPQFEAKPRPQEEPAASEQAARVDVRGFRFSGNRLIATPALQQRVSGWVGKRLTLAGLQQPVKAITELYRSCGYLLGRAYLPEQRIAADGVVEIAVVEAVYSRVSLNDSAILRANATAPLKNLQQGKAVDNRSLEQALLLLKDLPGVEVSSTLTPGADPGTTDLLIDLREGETYRADLRADNFGSSHYGRYRVGAGLELNNPGALGDRLSLRGLHGFSGGRTDYGSLFYQLPWGRHGLILTTGVTFMDYRLGGDYKSLKAVGDATVYTLDGRYPLLRSLRGNLYATARYTRKWLSDAYRATGFRQSRQSHAMTLQLNGDRRDTLWGGGLNELSLALKHGDLDMDNRSRQVDAAYADSAGRFNLLRLTYNRTQYLSRNWHLRGSVALQRSDKNLDSSEKLQLGGISGVRAYPSGELSADRGELFRLDCYRRLNEKWQVGAFYDLGHGKVNRNSYPGAAKTRTLRSVGLTLSAVPLPDWYFDATLAMPLGDQKATSEPDRDTRVWLQLIRTF